MTDNKTWESAEPTVSRAPTIVPCFVCGKELERVFPDTEAQPNNGVMCQTSGNYGSSVLDCFDGPGVMFLLCDRCLIVGAERVRTVVVTQTRPELRYEIWDTDSVAS